MFVHLRGPGRRREARRGTLFSRSMRLPLALVSLSCVASPAGRLGRGRGQTPERGEREGWWPSTPRQSSWRPADSCVWVGVFPTSWSINRPSWRMQQYNLFSSDTQTSSPYFVKDAAGSVTRTRACVLPLTHFFLRALYHNSLHCPEIKNCRRLRAVYVRANYLQGGIPPELAELVHLTILDLSSNLLRGMIQASIITEPLDRNPPPISSFLGFNSGTRRE